MSRASICSCLSWTTGKGFESLWPERSIRPRSWMSIQYTSVSVSSTLHPFPLITPSSSSETMPAIQKQCIPTLYHYSLETTFRGIEHPLSNPEAPIHQYLGIKYASVPARFRQSVLFRSYPPTVDASKHGCIIFFLLPPFKNLTYSI